jgi:hypothetical protein
VGDERAREDEGTRGSFRKRFTVTGEVAEVSRDGRGERYGSKVLDLT